MNTLQLIKARASKTQALEQARKQLTKAYGSDAHTDRSHTDVVDQASKCLTYRGVAYDPQSGNKESTGGRELRYRGVRYGVY